MHTVPERDDFELALARRAIERDIPFLGVCRGMQVMNVAQGGTLIQDLPTVLGHEHHCRVPGSFDGADHPVHLAAGSQGRAGGGRRAHRRRSRTIIRRSTGSARISWSPAGRISTSFRRRSRCRDRRFALGVQWHPEADETSLVIATLVEEAREYALARAA